VDVAPLVGVDTGCAVLAMMVLLGLAYFDLIIAPETVYG
jgi:hypothetical protein